jgi:hypothetical protein
LIAGTELEGFERAAARDESIVVSLVSAVIDARKSSRLPPLREWLSVLWLVGFFAGVCRLALDPIWTGDSSRQGIGVAVLLSGLLIVAAFMINRNIFSSDNYRYLIFLLPPWSLGFGLMMSDLARRGLRGRATGLILALMLIGATTASTIACYRDKLGYLNDECCVVRLPRRSWSEIPRSTSRRQESNLSPRISYRIPTDVSHVFGSYWDVYRMAFLSGKKVVGIPYPMYPNRFRGWSRGLGAGQGALLAIGARRAGISGQPRGPRFRADRSDVVVPATESDWRSPFEVVWQNDGRDSAELDRIRVVFPVVDRAGR